MSPRGLLEGAACRGVAPGMLLEGADRVERVLVHAPWGLRSDVYNYFYFLKEFGGIIGAKVVFSALLRFFL